MSPPFSSGTTSFLLNLHRFSPQIDPAWEQDKCFFSPAVLEMGSDTCDRPHSQQAICLVSQVLGCPKRTKEQAELCQHCTGHQRESMYRSQVKPYESTLVWGLPEIWPSGIQDIVLRKPNMLCSFSCFYMAFGLIREC